MPYPTSTARENVRWRRHIASASRLLPGSSRSLPAPAAITDLRAAGDTSCVDLPRDEICRGGKFCHVERVFGVCQSMLALSLMRSVLARRLRRVAGRGLPGCWSWHAEERAVQSDVFGTYREVDCPRRFTAEGARDPESPQPSG